MSSKKVSKAKGIYLIVFSILYFFYTVFFVGHGIGIINTTITLWTLIWGIMELNKSLKGGK